MTAEEGIRVRPSTKEGGKPSYEARVFDRRQDKTLTRSFPSLAAARKWRKDTASRLRVAPDTVALSDSRKLEVAVAEWLEGCHSGRIKSRRGINYGAQTLAGYERSFRKYILPLLGSSKFTSITDADVQRLVGDLNEKGLHGRTVRNVVTALQAFYHHHRRIVRQDPTRDIDLPDATSRKRSIVSPDRAFTLLDAIQDDEARTAYALAFFAGLRRGEIRALEQGNLLADRIVITHSYDETAKQRVPLKWRKDGEERTIPRTRALGRYLTKLPGTEVSPQTLYRRAASAWNARYACGCIIPNVEGEEAPETCAEHKQSRMTGIDLHECRHSFATWLDEAGISNSRADKYTGHSNKAIGELYRHLTAEQIKADAETLDSYLAAPKAEVVALGSRS
jgi:integrase